MVTCIWQAEEDLEEAHKTVEDNIDEAEISSSIKVPTPYTLDPRP